MEVNIRGFNRLFYTSAWTTTKPCSVPCPIYYQDRREILIFRVRMNSVQVGPFELSWESNRYLDEVAEPRLAGYDEEWIARGL